MKRLGILGACLVAAFSISAVATATEELPEIGRCAKPAGAATHRYATSNCTLKSEGESTGKYEWEPGPGAKASFTSTAEATELETVGKTKLKCHGGTAKGELTGPKTDTATITFTECEYGGVVCSTPGAGTGELVTSQLAGTLGYISGAGTGKPVVGIRLAPVTGTQFAGVECGGVAVSISGSVVGLLTAQINKMSLTSTLKFKATAGKQSPEALEGGATSVLSATAGSEAEQAGLTTSESNANEELLEVKATT
jgi:hypothetical protein